MAGSSAFDYIVHAVNPPRAKSFERLYINRRSILVIASSLSSSDLQRIASRLKIQANDIDWISVSDKEALVSVGNKLKVLVKGHSPQTIDFTKSPISHVEAKSHEGQPCIRLGIADKPDSSRHIFDRLDFAGSGAASVRNRVLRLLEPHNRLSIGIFGATGVGKSTLINAILGSDLAKTGVGPPQTKGRHLFVTPDQKYALHDIEGWDATEGTKGLERVMKTIEDLENAGTGCALDTLWYCINTGSSRNVEIEEELVQRVQRMGVPVQLVITRASANQDTAFEKKLLSDPLTTLLKPNFVRSKEEYRKAPHGIDELLVSTRELVARVRF